MKSYVTLFYAMDADFKRFEPRSDIVREPASQRGHDDGPRSMLDPLHISQHISQDSQPFAQVFNVLLNYWEVKPTQYEAKLHELALKDIRIVCAFVPWSHVETDIYHSLKKFLRAASVVKMNVRLYVMPELGVNYPNSGVPRDIIQNHVNLAVGRKGQVIYNYCAPNIFPLPSFFSTEVLKRFGNYLIKFGSVLSEVFQEVGRSDFCEVVVSNSFFNYYRNFGLRPAEHGDYSAAHVMAFRDFLDREYAGQGGEQFKMQVYEPINRHRFFSHIEKSLREKTEMIFSRKKTRCVVRHIDLLNPESSPEMGYQSLMVEMFDFRPSVERFYESIVAAGDRGESVFLNSSGVFRRFSDQEKSFLIIACLIHTGDVAVSFEEINGLSPAFQKKLSHLIGVIKEKSYLPHRRMAYVSASKFAMNERCYSTLSRMAPGIMSLSSSIAEEASESARHYKDTSATSNAATEECREVMRFNKRLIFLDPQTVIRMVDLVQAFSLAQVGKVVAIPAPFGKLPNYMQDATLHLDKFRKLHKPLKINIGISYEVYEYQLGYVVLYNPEQFWSTAFAAESDEPKLGKETTQSNGLALFFQALLGLAEVRSICQVNDSRIHVVSYVSQNDQNSRLLFLVNSSKEEIQATLKFTETVGLAAAKPDSAMDVGDGEPNLQGDLEQECIVGKTFELSVPALGVLSMKLVEPSASQLSEQGQESTWN